MSGKSRWLIENSVQFDVVNHTLFLWTYGSDHFNLLATPLNTVRSCSLHGVVPAKLHSEQPGSVIPVSKNIYSNTCKQFSSVPYVPRAPPISSSLITRNHRHDFISIHVPRVLYYFSLYFIICVIYIATCFAIFLSPSDSLQPMHC
jgi:hypothetical protein